jgi:hypothetical protein
MQNPLGRIETRSLCTSFEAVEKVQLCAARTCREEKCPPRCPCSPLFQCSDQQVRNENLFPGRLSVAGRSLSSIALRPSRVRSSRHPRCNARPLFPPCLSSRKIRGNFRIANHPEANDELGVYHVTNVGETSKKLTLTRNNFRLALLSMIGAECPVRPCHLEPNKFCSRREAIPSSAPRSSSAAR